MEKVIVIGGNGFLGTYLVAELKRKSYRVLVGDLVEPTDKIRGVDYEFCDILDKASIDKLIDKNISIVYNLAGYANLDLAVNEPIKTFNLNVIGNLNVLEVCREKNVKRYVYASSAYAMSNKGSFYGISKLTSEKNIEEYQKRYDLNYTILRYGSVYSDKKFDNNYVYSIIEEAVNSGKINHTGNGEEVREYIHAIDAAKLSVDILENRDAINSVLMLSGVEKIKRKDLFLMIAEIVDKNIEINLSKEASDHHYQFTPYSYEPTQCKKIVANPYIDMGQGILACIKSVYNNDEL